MGHYASELPDGDPGTSFEPWLSAPDDATVNVSIKVSIPVTLGGQYDLAVERNNDHRVEFNDGRVTLTASGADRATISFKLADLHAALAAISKYGAIR